MFFSNDHTSSRKKVEVGNFWVEPSSYHERFRTSPFLLESNSSKFQRIQKWVKIATIELKKWKKDNLDSEGNVIRGKQNGSQSAASSDYSIDTEGYFAIVKGFKHNTNEDTVDDQPMESIYQDDNAVVTGISANQAEVMGNQGATGGSAKTREQHANCNNKKLKKEAVSTVVFKVKSPPSPKEYVIVKIDQRQDVRGIQNYNANTLEPQLSSGKGDVSHCRKKVDSWNIKMSPIVPGVSNDWTNFTVRKINNCVGAAEVSIPKMDINPWKRKMSKEEADLPVEEKRLKRLQRFTVNSKCLNKDNELDLKQPNAVNYTLDEIIKKKNLQYSRRPTTNFPKEVESDPEENKDDMILPKQREPITRVLRQKLPDVASLEPDDKKSGKPRPIIIDGCNVAKEYGKDVFDFEGIQVCVSYFLAAGHTDIIVVVPERYLKPCEKKVANLDILHKLKTDGRLLTCWSRQIGTGKWVSSYDDRMIIEVASKRDGVIVSNDKYRDLYKEVPKWRDTIFKRLLPFRFMPGKPDEILFPHDPFGRYGPTLTEFLHFE